MKTPTQKKHDMMMFIIHTLITKTQIMISIEVHAFNKVIFVHVF
jgi:hypothetical protein